MSIKRTAFWLILTSVVVLFLYEIRDVLLPFIIALIFAYSLNPLVYRLTKLKISRTNATLIISLAFFLPLVFLSIKLLPIFYKQIGLFINNIPNYRNYIQQEIVPYLTKFINSFDPDFSIRIENEINNLTTQSLNYLGIFMNNIWKSGLAFVNVLSLIFISPFITYYVIKDWDKITITIKKWLPVYYRKTIIKQFQLIDKALSGFLMGQALICLFLATFYSICLYIVKLKFAFFIGIATGILVFIPYVGFFVGASTGIITAAIQFKDLKMVIIVAIIFIIGQLIEGNFLTPRVMSEKVGLHPVWVFFALLASASLFGFVGVLFAIPVAAIIGVIARLMVSIYLNSSIYKQKE